MLDRFALKFSTLEEFSDKELKSKLTVCGCVEFCHEIPDCYHLIDVAICYLELAYLGERLSQLDQDIKLTKYSSLCCFKFIPKNMEQCIRCLRELERMFMEDDCGAGPPLLAEETSEFLSSTKHKPVKFPELLDLYYANSIAANSDWSDEEKYEIYSEHPEWAYHCWCSARSSECGYDLYVSPSFWMMPADADYRLALKLASDIDLVDVEMKEFSHLVIANEAMCLLGVGLTVSFPQWLHLQLLEIASILFPVDWEPGSMYWSCLNGSCRFLISENRDFLICEGERFTYLLFREDFSVVGQDALEILFDYVSDGAELLQHQAGLRLTYECKWDRLDDERFELLCYDLLRRDGRFNSKRIHKMGLAKSRDGGRDIVAHTPSRTGSSSESWLVQCKCYQSKKSLGRNDISLAELIAEYDPTGIIIATNLVVDAGTYDKFERISKNQSVDIEVWSGLEIERMVNQHPDLYKKYFELW